MDRHMNRYRLKRWIGGVLASLCVVAGGLVGTAAPAAADDGVIAEWQGGNLIGRAQNGWHGWGRCRVVDFNGGSWGWYIRSASGVAAPTYRVHHGSLQGWVAQGGAAGWLGCPTSEEYAWGHGWVRQNFQGGLLTYVPGMAGSQATSYGMANVIDRFLRREGQWGGNICIDANLGSGGYVGGYSGGQCKQALNCAVWGAIGRNPALGYAQTGAYRVARDAARTGDVVQTTSPHTAVIIANYGGGRFLVVDSNYVAWERVGVHDWSPPAGAEYWRY